MLRRLGLLLIALAVAMPAQAAVTVQFYSREFGNYFPHAFIVLSGHPDNDPRPMDADYGFTAVSVSPAILMGPVKGIVEPAPKGYVQGSTRHFTIQVTDAQYARIRAIIDEWKALPQPSYDLHKRNCVSFTAAIAREVGLHADDDAKLVTKPHAYLEKVRLANPVLGDGQGTVTAQAIAQANGGRLPTTAPVGYARAAPPPPAPQQPSAAAVANGRYVPQSQLSAAAIAAGYKPAPSTSQR